jgi:hypothetical protein
MRQKGIMVLLWLTIVETCLFAILFTAMDDGTPFWYFPAGYSLYISLAIMSIAGAFYVFNRRTERIETGLDADDAVRLLTEHLGWLGYSVRSTDQRVLVLLDPSRNARIEVIETERGSDLLVYPSLTKDGLGSMVSYSLILPFCGTVGLWMSYRSARMTEEFGQTVLRPTVIYLEAKEKSKPKGSERQEVASVISATLKKANRLATEAFMGLSSGYSDAKWSIPLVGFIAYAALAFTLILTRDLNAPWPAIYTYFLEFMLAAMTAIVILSLIWLRLRYRQESQEVNGRIGELQAAISREEGTVAMADGAESPLETLLNVCPDLPRWTRYRSRSFNFRNPGMATVLGWSLFVMCYVWFGLSAAGLGLPAAAIFLSVLVSLYAGTRWRNLRADRRSLEQWKERIGTLRGEIENRLQEL